LNDVVIFVVDRQIFFIHMFCSYGLMTICLCGPQRVDVCQPNSHVFCIGWMWKWAILSSVEVSI